MDNSTIDQLEKGLATLGLTLPATAIAQLVAWADELVRWNAKVNLTAIRQPLEIVDKHLLDSLAVLPEVAGATRLLDLGAGAGLPGLPLAVALPDLRATLVDAVAKKVGFLKAAAVKAGVAARVKALHLRVNGNPAAEHLEPADLVISRAFLDVGPFLALARSYVEPGGRVVVMLGQSPSEADLTAHGSAANLRFISLRRFTLPLSGDPRGVAVFRT